MKPAALLNHEKTLQRGDEEYPVIDASESEPLLTFAKENGMKVRAHTLVWHQQTPRWLFTEGFSDSADAPLVSREIMLKRMENYICQVMTYFNQNYPGLITGWDVVDEAIDPNSQEENHMLSEGNVTFWGLDDSRTWLNNDGNIHYPLLFDEKLNPKPAFFGAILDDSI